MGGQISLYKNPNELLQKYLPDFTFSKKLVSSPYFESFICSTQDEGHVVCKAFRYDLTEENDMVEQQMQQMQWQFEILNMPNVLALTMERFEERDGNKTRSIFLAYRQFVYQSLQEKLRIKIPKILLPEKKWLIFQILCGLSQIHEKSLVHGDIKPENILVTSYNQVFLTDMVVHKPSYFKDDDLKGYNMYYGELDNNQRCYFAPERFRELYDDSFRHHDKLEKQMDIFSVGCVIAEIMMDGHVFFDLAKLQQYRRGLYNPKDDLEKRMHDKKVVELILKMIHIDPKQRPDINSCIKDWDSQAMPHAFSRVFYQLNSSFVRPQNLFSDMKISLIRKYMPSIWRTCFDASMSPREIVKMFKEPIERQIFDKLREDDIDDYNHMLIPSATLFNFLGAKDDSKLDIKIQEFDKDGALIVIHWIGAFINTCYFPQSRRCALEMLQIIGRNSSLEIRLQYILPYVFKMFEDKQSKVQAKAMETAVLLFENILDDNKTHILTTTDYLVFDNYIMPHYMMFDQSTDHMIQLTFLKYLPLLAKIGHRFTEMALSSKLARKQHSSQSIDDTSTEEQSVLSFVDGGAQQNMLVMDPDFLSTQIDSSMAKKESEEHKNDHNHHHEAEIFVNYDREIEELRGKFVSLIQNKMAKSDTHFLRMMYSKLGQFSDFIGTQKIMDYIIPFIGLCANQHKEFVNKLDGLQSVTIASIRVGKRTTYEFIGKFFENFLTDSEELVVLEYIKTLSRLLRLRLIPKVSLIPNESTYGQNSDHLLHKILPFLLHPNTWIRQEALNFILILADHENTKVFTKAEVYCILGKKLKDYLQNEERRNDVLFGKKSSRELLELLRSPLSRVIFEFYVKTDFYKSDNKPEMKHTQSDNYAFEKMSEIIKNTQQKYQMQYQSRLTNQALQENNQQFLESRRALLYSQYRIVRVQTIKMLSKLNMLTENEDNSGIQKKGRAKNTNNYYNGYFDPCNIIKDQEDQNFGLNKNSLEHSKQSKEIDFVMQAMNLLPEDSNIPLINYQNKKLFTTVANQALPDNWRLQIEKLGHLVAQPNEIPQFSYDYSRMTSVELKSSNKESAFVKGNSIGDERKATMNFRPQGRLLTTLYEHRNPVNCITVTEDQNYFFTSSRQDGVILGWETKLVETDAKSHSKFKIQSKRKVNSICSLQGSEYFCAAGSEEGIDIYEIGRLNQQHQIVKTIEHKGEGEMVQILDTMLPVSHQHLLAYSSQRGSLFMHDLRCRKQVLHQKEAFSQSRGLITCMTQGQDPYQLVCGTIGGYVMVYDVRFDLVSTCYKHSQKYPINSIATFKPNLQAVNYNRSNTSSPMALISSGAPSYELSLLNLDTGNIEILMTVNEPAGSDSINAMSSFYRESAIRDNNNWPEKSETNDTMFRRYLKLNQSLINPNQIKLTKNVDDELFKELGNRYKLIKNANESVNACRKVLVPRKYSNLLQGTITADYAITGGNDMRLRYWNLNNPAGGSYLINTPDNDECQYFSEIVSGGVQLIQEQLSKVKNFPQINANMLHAPSQQRVNSRIIPNTNPQVEMRSDSIYYSILQNLIAQNYADEVSKDSIYSAKKYLTESSLGDISSGVAHQYQIEVTKDSTTGKDKIMVYNYNGLSEWQHLNGFCGTEGNANLHNNTYNDFRSQDGGKQGGKRGDIDNYISQPYRNAGGIENSEDSNDYLFRESKNISHSDTILDMAIIEVNQNSGRYNQSDVFNNVQPNPMLVTCSRDCTIKLWR